MSVPSAHHKQIAEERELEAACDALAMSCREGGERQALDAVAELEEATDQRLGLVGAEAIEERHVGARAEDVARSSKDQRAQALSPFDFVERGAQAGDHLSVDPVERWGVDRQERKRAARLLPDAAGRHHAAPEPPAARASAANSSSP
jgi:hypothetical protein